MSIVSRIYGTWRDVMDNKSDPRTTDLFMMSSPLPTILMSLSYICIVKVTQTFLLIYANPLNLACLSQQFIGPRLMANRKPYNARKLQLYYNSLHLIVNAYLFYRSCVNGWMTSYNYRCQAVDFSQTGLPLRVCSFNILFIGP